MTTTVSKVRIFVASPTDVTFERDALGRVIDELNHTVAPDKGLALELIRWETHCHPLMGRAQAVINKQVGKYDIFVGIMWKKFGSPTGVADAGTEEEFKLGFTSWKESSSPLIMFYFCQAPFMPHTQEELEQVSKVLNFRKELQEVGLVWEYPNAEHFADAIRPHLVRVLIDISEENSEVRVSPPKPTPSSGSRIYLVSGTDRDMGEKVRQYLESLGLKVVSLQGVVDQGRTIIEKFEQTLVGVEAAVVLLPSDSSEKSRQNVIFEIGYFMGKFGRSRVFVLTEDSGTKIPTDMMGAIYLNYQKDRIEPALLRVRRELQRLDTLRSLKELGF